MDAGKVLTAVISGASKGRTEELLLHPQELVEGHTFKEGLQLRVTEDATIKVIDQPGDSSRTAKTSEKGIGSVVHGVKMSATRVFVTDQDRQFT
jgi:hypothetical protein